MKKKRELTPEELRMAALIKSKIASHPDFTQETLGDRLGVSQGMISHWADGRSAVTAKKARPLAEALGIEDPAAISVDYRDIVGTGSASHGLDIESLPVRLGASTILKLVETHQFLVEMYRDMGRVFDIEREPERFAEAWSTLLKLPDGHTLREAAEISKQLSWIMPQGATGYGRGSEVPTKGTLSRKVGK